MMFSSTLSTAIERMYDSVRAVLSRATESERDKRYIQTLSEVASFLSVLREFVKTCSYLDNVYKDLRYGRVCSRWYYIEDGMNIALLKLKPRTVISYDGAFIKVSYGDREVAIGGREVRYRVNNHVSTIRIDDERDVISKRSLLLEALGKLKSHIEHVTSDFVLCSKTVKQH